MSIFTQRASGAGWIDTTGIARYSDGFLSHVGAWTLRLRFNAPAYGAVTLHSAHPRAVLGHRRSGSSWTATTDAFVPRVEMACASSLLDHRSDVPSVASNTNGAG